MQMKTIDTPYGKKTPELLCRAMDALEVQPELLEVLENCLGNINPERGFADELEEEIRAAIAKARGEA